MYASSKQSENCVTVLCRKDRIPDSPTKLHKKKRSKRLFIVESALSLSSYFTGTPLKYLETNNSNTREQD